MFSPWVLLLLSILAVYVNASPLLEARKNGGANKGGTANNFNIAEAQCTIPNTGLSFGGAITASLTAEPKTGTAGCKSQYPSYHLKRHGLMSN
ncbi:unnamed protein product [Aureobasidium pullulans]|nr:unnamed protein product [Aureobasidium pullulans]